MFNDKIYPINYNVVAIIGGKYPIKKLIGKDRWYWNDDEGKMHTNK